MSRHCLLPLQPVSRQSHRGCSHYHCAHMFVSLLSDQARKSLSIPTESHHARLDRCSVRRCRPAVDHAHSRNNVQREDCSRACKECCSPAYVWQRTKDLQILLGLVSQMMTTATTLYSFNSGPTHAGCPSCICICQHEGSRNSVVITQCPACAQCRCQSCRRPARYYRRLNGPAPCHPAARAYRSRAAADPPARTPWHAGSRLCPAQHEEMVVSTAPRATQRPTGNAGAVRSRRHRASSSSADVASCSFAVRLAAHLDCCHVGCGGVACKVQALEAAPQVGQRVKCCWPRFQRILAKPEVLASKGECAQQQKNSMWVPMCNVTFITAYVYAGLEHAALQTPASPAAAQAPTRTVAL